MSEADRDELYLIDENVFREMGKGGNARVHAWLATVDDDQFRVSAITFLEKREGWERQRRKLAAQGKDVAAADAALAGLDRFEADYADRQIPIDLAISREVARLLGAKAKNRHDMILAATARLHGLVIVSRNVKDFAGRGVRILDRFASKPRIRQL